MSKTKCLTLFFLLIALNGTLFWCAKHYITTPNVPFYCTQLGTTIVGYSIIGLGLSLPMIFLSLMFGWLQVILLITGHITPHIKNAGFLDSLQILIYKILAIKQN